MSCITNCLMSCVTFVETQSSVHSPFQKLNFLNDSQKHAKVDIKHFLPCPILLDFSALFQVFCQGCLSNVQGCLLQTFSVTQSISTVFNGNVKQVYCVKVLNLMVLLKYYFSDKVKVKNLLWKALMVLCVIYPVLLCFVIFFVLFISVCFFFFFCFCTYVDFKLILIFPLVRFCFHCIFPSLFCLSLNYLFFVS